MKKFNNKKSLSIVAALSAIIGSFGGAKASQSISQSSGQKDNGRNIQKSKELTSEQEDLEKAIELSLKDQKIEEAMKLMTAVKKEGIYDIDLNAMKVILNSQTSAQIEGSIQNFTEMLKGYKVNQVMKLITAMKEDGVANYNLKILENQFYQETISEIDDSIQSYTTRYKDFKVSKAIKVIAEMKERGVFDFNLEEMKATLNSKTIDQIEGSIQIYTEILEDFKVNEAKQKAEELEIEKFVQGRQLRVDEAMVILEKMRKDKVPGFSNDDLSKIQAFLSTTSVPTIDKKIQEYTETYENYKKNQAKQLSVFEENDPEIQKVIQISLEEKTRKEEQKRILEQRELEQALKSIQKQEELEKIQEQEELLKIFQLSHEEAEIEKAKQLSLAEAEQNNTEIKKVDTPVKIGRPLPQPNRPLPQPNKVQSNQILEEKKESVSSNPILPVVPVSTVAQEAPRKNIPDAPGKMVVAKNIPNAPGKMVVGAKKISASAPEALKSPAPKAPVKVVKKAITSDVSMADQIANIARNRNVVNTEELEKKVQGNKAVSKQSNSNGVVQLIGNGLDDMIKAAQAQAQAQDDINEAKVEDDEWGDDDNLMVQPSVQQQEQPTEAQEQLTKVVQETPADAPVVYVRSQAEILADLQAEQRQGELLRGKLNIMSKDIHKKDKDDDWDD